jgi:hypothetical protein
VKEEIILHRIKRYVSRIAGSREKAAILSGLTSKERALISRIDARRPTYFLEKRLASLASMCRLAEFWYQL